MLLQPDKSDFILSMIKEVGLHEARSHCTLMKKSEVNNKHKKKDVKLKTMLYIWYFKRKRFPNRRSMKHKDRLCAHGEIQQWVVKYWETYSPVVSWISMRSL